MSHFQDKILEKAFEKALYIFNDDTIDHSVKIIQNYLYLHCSPEVYSRYSEDVIREALIEYQKDKEIKWRINNYILKGEIIYTDPESIMKKLNITDERYLHDINLVLKSRERQTLNL